MKYQIFNQKGVWIMFLKKIHIRDFKMIELAEIDAAKVNQIVGENNNGKTTVLQAIQFAFTGSSDSELVRNGADSAEVCLEFGSDVEIKRTINREGRQNLKVKIGDMSPQRPQTYLNSLIGVGTFNPQDVLDPKKRTEYFLKAIDIKVDPKLIEEVAGGIKIPDFDYTHHGLKVIDQVASYFYHQRSVVNKEVKTLESQFNAYSSRLNKPEEPKIKCDDKEIEETLEEYKRELNGLKDKESAWVERVNKLNETKQLLKDRQHDLDKILVEVDRLKNDIKETEDTILQMSDTIGAKPDIAEEAKDINDSIEKLNKELFSRNKMKLYNEQKSVVDGLKVNLDRKHQEANKLDSAYKKIKGSITTSLMINAKLPVDGLTYEDGVFKLDGVDISQLSSSKALILALRVVKKLNKKSNLICIDGAELLDNQTYNELNKEMQSDDFNYFLAKVGEAFPSKMDKVINMDKGIAQ